MENQKHNKVFIHKLIALQQSINICIKDYPKAKHINAYKKILELIAPTIQINSNFQASPSNLEGPKFTFEDQGTPEIKEETSEYTVYRIFRVVTYNERFKDSSKIGYTNVYEKPDKVYTDGDKYTDVPNSNKDAYSEEKRIILSLEKNYDELLPDSNQTGFWVEWKISKSKVSYTYKGKKLKEGANHYDMDVVFHDWWYSIDGGLKNKDAFDKEIIELAALMKYIDGMSIELIGHVGGRSDAKWTDGNGKVTYEQLAIRRADSIKKELVRILTDPKWNVKNTDKRIVTKKGNINDSTKVEIIIYIK